MSYVQIIIFLGVVLPVLVLGGLIFLHRKSFKYEALIIRKVGDAHMFVKDRFRSRPLNTANDRDDVQVIEFLKHIKNKSLVPQFKYWSQFWNNKKYEPEHATKMPQKLLQRCLRQGAVFYQANEHELKPVTINDSGALTVLDQDSRAFIVSQMLKKQDFLRTGQSKWAQVLMVVGPIFLVVIASLIMWIIFQNNMTENIASICGQAANNGGNGFLDTVRGVAA